MRRDVTSRNVRCTSNARNVRTRETRPLPVSIAAATSAAKVAALEERHLSLHMSPGLVGLYRILCHTPIILSLSPLKNLLRSGCSLVYLATIYLELDIFDGVLVDLRLLCYAITAPEHSSTLYGLTNSYLPHSGFPKYLYNVVTTVTARIS